MSHIHVGRDGTQFGPYSETRARSLFAQGTITADDLVWREGFESWRPASSVFSAAVLGGEATYAEAPGLPNLTKSVESRSAILKPAAEKKKSTTIWKAIGVVVFLAVVVNTLIKLQKGTTTPPAEIAIQRAAPKAVPKTGSADQRFMGLWADAYEYTRLAGISPNYECRQISGAMLARLSKLRAAYEASPGNAEVFIPGILNESKNAMNAFSKFGCN